MQEYNFRAKDPNPFDRMPRLPSILDYSGIFAKCPKCGRITNIRTCYGCKELMCEDCLIEHQIICLHKDKEISKSADN